MDNQVLSSHKTAVLSLRAIVIMVLFALVTQGCGGAVGDKSTTPGEADQSAGKAVEPYSEMVVFLMPRCPHCATLLKTLLPLKREMGDDLALSFGYVGRVDADGKATFSEGEAEAEIAQIQLCAGMTSTGSQWFDFMECSYKDDQWRKLPKGWTECAEKAKVDVAAVSKCVDDGHGAEELARSIEIAAKEGIMGAPTIFLNGRHFAGERGRKQILSQLCYTSQSDRPRPKICADVEPLPIINGTLLTDKRCDDPKYCDVDREVEFLKSLMLTLEVTEVDYATPEGKTLYKDVVKHEGPSTLPLLVLDKGINEFADAKRHMEDHLMSFGEGFIIPLGLGWDPTKEICDNEKDDNENGAVDCKDEDCSSTLPCRAEEKGKLDLFIMSQCPFGIGLIPSVELFLGHLKRDRKKVDFKLRFIGSIDGDSLDSMHGESEVQEDLRMACAQDLYPTKYKFMEYVKCRSKRYHSSEWEECVPKWMNKKKLQKCAEGERGQALLKESFTLAEAVGFTGSPSWMIDNNKEIEGRTAVKILAAFCAHNRLKECKKPLKKTEEDSEVVPPQRCE